MTSFWRENDVTVKYLYIAYEKHVCRHDDITFCPTVFENLNLASSYKGLSSHQIWFSFG